MGEMERGRRYNGRRGGGAQEEKERGKAKGRIKGSVIPYCVAEKEGRRK